MSQFDVCFRKTLQWEGGYVCDPDDPGGCTKYGISKAAFPWVDIEALTIAAAKDLYYLHYWCKIQGMLIDDQAMAEAIFDASVNLGVSAAVKIAQKIAGTAADGMCGHNTLKALREVDPAWFVAQYALERIRYYVGICKNKIESRKYLLGWVRRALYFA